MEDARKAELKKAQARVRRENRPYLEALLKEMQQSVVDQKLADIDFGFSVQQWEGDPGACRIVGRAGIIITVERRKSSTWYSYAYGEILGARLRAIPDWRDTANTITRRNRAFQGLDAKTIAPKIVKMAAKYLQETDVRTKEVQEKRDLKKSVMQKWTGVFKDIPDLEIPAKQRVQEPAKGMQIHQTLVLKAPGVQILAALGDDAIALNIYTVLDGHPDNIKGRLKEIVELLGRFDYFQFLERTEEGQDGDEVDGD